MCTNVCGGIGVIAVVRNEATRVSRFIGNYCWQVVDVEHLAQQRDREELHVLSHKPG